MHLNSDQTDEELVEAYKISGDQKLIGLLFKRHLLMCFAVCNKYFMNPRDSEDAVMEIFEKLIHDLKKFEIKNFKSWLHSVCRNHCLMQLRKNTPERNSMDVEEISETFMKSDESMHPYNNKDEIEFELQRLEKALNLLKGEQKECIELFYLKKKKYEEIVSITGYSPKEVKSYIQNGKRNLKNILGEKGFFILMLCIWIF
ncbi:MAG: sigma-70 family RNA polymerase sigma factor [Flavobacteriales bacterium]|nr:sigma-70 family RNA polymerase sigma factor [Flavobacteriales bacterium]